MRRTTKPPTIENVALVEAALDQRQTLANLMQLYLHDFSEFAAVGTAHGDVGLDGKFTYDRLESYWQDDGRIPLLIHAEERLVGFVLVNQWSALNRPLDQSVAEFFVLRKYRRIRNGSQAAALLFARFPGRWEIPVASYNHPALVFWRKTIVAAVGENFQEFAGDGKRWAGTVLCFDN